MSGPSIQPQLRVDQGATALTFYAAAFGAKVLHRVGDGEDIVAQLAIGDASFWVAATGSSRERLVPRELGGATGRLLLCVDDPDAVFGDAIAAGAAERIQSPRSMAGASAASSTPSATNGKSASL